MKFFVPAADDSAQAERVYAAIAKHHNAISLKNRIFELSWKHNGKWMKCCVGGPAPEYYGTGQEPVVAILDCGNLYKICTTHRGVVRGEPIFAGKNDNSYAIHFEAEQKA